MKKTEVTERKPRMNPMPACEIIGGFCRGEGATPDEWLEAYQYLVSTRIVWRLEGFYGRTAADLIQAGLITA